MAISTRTVRATLLTLALALSGLALGKGVNDGSISCDGGCPM